ncbi:MAG: Ferrous iron transport protein B [Lentisphaerae bacterium ADurb.Bin242]|nr:MAG: Ferrous iron transport protein B [Lentisphaerae bacterium ADurb.Bin242]
MKKHFRVVLAGNPNCGKTCIFNALTGTLPTSERP